MTEKIHSNSEDGSSHKSNLHAKGTTHSVNHTSKKKVTLNKKFWQYTSAILAVLLLISLFANWDINITKTGTVADSADNNDANGIDLSSFYDDDDPMIGDADAPVTIVEFSDFECPYCARGHTVIQQIIENQVAAGDVKIVFRDFPLSFHAQARPAALAAECANEQDMFWEYHDLIFENQNSLSDSSYLQWASDLALDIDQFTECYESEKYSSEVYQDFSDGQKLGVSGTPAFFVNGELISGAQPYSVFEAAINAALN